MKERRDAAWKKAAAAWLEASAAIDAAKAKIIELAKAESCYGAGVKHQRTPQAGRVDYTKVPELDGVDLEPYPGRGRISDHRLGYLEADMEHRRILDFVLAQHWAICPEVLEQILAIARGENESPEAVADKLGRPLQNTRTVTHRDGVAVIPVTGPVFRYANLFTEISGATSVEVLAADFRAAIDNPDIRGVVLEIDSPGGQVAGISEFAEQVRAASKPVVSYISDLGASAAYWIASAAGRVVMRDTASAGSVGVVATLRRGKQDNTIEIVSSQSPKKRPDLDTEAGRAELQTVIDDIAQVFVEKVAAYRGVKVEHVLAHFGQGGVMVGASAVRAGLADEMGSLEKVIAGLTGKSNLRGKLMATNNDQASVAPAADHPERMTREFVATNHPELLAALLEEGRTEGLKQGLTEGLDAGAEIERGRIQAVKAVSLPGHEALIEALMFDGKTSGPDAAGRVIEAEKVKRDARLQAIAADAPKSVPHAVAPVSGEAADASLPLEERCKRAWERDPELRGEFRDNFKAYLAWSKAEAAGTAKVLRRG
ncbi:MAG: S49 family peptidase [Pseudomonadota bacterium]|nr:S49 family peptidase [Pseudomonadota bacterium]